MTCCILILLWVQDELSYDRFHENASDIYRVIQDINFTDHSTTWTITQGPLGPSLKKDFPEIINATRITGRRFRLTYNNRSFDEVVGMADSSTSNPDSSSFKLWIRFGPWWHNLCHYFLFGCIFYFIHRMYQFYEPGYSSFRESCQRGWNEKSGWCA